ncbi:MAG: tetratricopeptide repeat protein [Cyanobacteria bacterium REEB67]|nr:tetratricopeptide repeat protein [Cyanobacteria bacterium REEB67]
MANSFDSLHSIYKGHIGWHPIGVTLAGVAETAHELRLYPISEISARAALLDYPKGTTNDTAYTSALFHIGLSCAERNDPYAAGSYLQKSLENFYDVSRLHTPHYFPCEPMQAITNLYVAHNHPEEAMQLFESQISRLEMQKWRLQAQNQPVNYSLIEDFYHRAGDLSYSLGYYGSSERYFKKAVLFSRLADKNNIFIDRERFFSIAVSQVKQGKYQEADSYLAACARLESRSPNLCYAAPYTRVLQSLVYEKTARHAQAASLAEGLAAVVEENPGTLVWYSDLLTSQGKFKEATTRLKIALISMRANLGECDPLFLKTKQRLARLEFLQGNLKEARAMAENINDIQRQVVGNWSLDTAYTFEVLAACDAANGNYEKATSEVKRALNIKRMGLGSNVPCLADK